MDVKASLVQAERDVAAARERIEETYHEWAAQLSREAASDALSLIELEAGLDRARPDRIGVLEDRVQRLAEADELPSELGEAARVLDEVLEGTLEPDHEPDPAWKEGGGEQFTTREDALEAVQAGETIVEGCRQRLEQPGGDDEPEG